jgi:hypothetical protein
LREKYSVIHLGFQKERHSDYQMEIHLVIQKDFPKERHLVTQKDRN